MSREVKRASSGLSSSGLWRAPGAFIRSRGYTIVELMIVVTILGIIAGIAYPSYLNYTKVADRAKAKADLYELAQIMEKGFTDNRAYNVTDMTDTLDLFNTTEPVLYDYSITSNAAGYRVSAVVNGSRDPYDLSITETGSEEYRDAGGSSWTSGGWDAIPDS